MGLPYGPQGLLKAPPELHRPDIKPTGLEGPACAEERIRNSVSPTDREKYRTRSSLGIEVFLFCYCCRNHIHLDQMANYVYGRSGQEKSKWRTI
ncbi:protein groucho-like [Haematobia irritans]|uniref:protein groucho-like n=1 Tax=Haematobia irritans TaxID=7368 RepID=UPI003F50BDF8